MKTMTIGVSTRAEFNARLKAAFEGHKQGTRYSFPSLEAMQRTLTSNRWDMLRAMLGGERMGVRELARRLERDVKAVHTDVHALAACGIVDRDAEGRFVFPFDAIHVDFMVKAA